MSVIDDLSNAVRVYLGINSRGIIDNAFVLDDPTYGLLDASVNTLGGTVWVDVTSSCSGQINTNTGRSREVDQFQAGTASFTLRNEDRAFDPSNTASTYYPNITPRLPVQITLAAADYAPPIFTGYVDDIQVDYEMPNICTTTFTCVDAFSLLANMPVDGLTVTAGLPGVVINQVLDYVGFPATRNIDPGNTPIQSSTPTGDALTYLQTVAASEDGWLYVDAYGSLRFLDRRSLSLSASSYGLLLLADTNVSSGITNRLAYSGINQASQALLLYNTVTGQRTGGTVQTATNSASVASYLPRALSLPTLESATNAEVLNLCNWLVSAYGTPETRFASAAINLASVTGWSLVQLPDYTGISRCLTVARQMVAGDPTTGVSVPSIIEGASYSLDVSGSSYTVDLSFGSLARLAYFRLDDATFGVLDSSLVAY